MNLLIEVSYYTGETAKKFEVVMNTDNITIISPPGYDSKHSYALVRMTGQYNDCYITTEVYEKLMKKITVTKL